MEMHHLYSAVPRISFESYARALPQHEDTLALAMCALIVDPHDAEDAAKEYGIVGTPHKMSDFRGIGRVATRLALQTASAWIAAQRGANVINLRYVAGSLSGWDMGVFAWCMSAVVRACIETYPTPNKGLLIRAVSIVERWSVSMEGRPDMDEAAWDIAETTWENESGGGASVSMVTTDLINSTQNKTSATHYGSELMRTASMLLAGLSDSDDGIEADEWYSRVRDAEIGILQILSDACLSFPI